MNKITYSQSIANAIRRYLNEVKWQFHFDDKQGVFTFGKKFKGRVKTVIFNIHVREDDYIVYATSLLGVSCNDKALMTTMAEFICRVNYELCNGGFELNMDNGGELRYKCFVDCEGITPTFEMVSNSIHCPDDMFYHYVEGIADVIFKNMTAKEAYEKCENTWEEVMRLLFGDELDSEENEATIPDTSPDSDDDEIVIKTELFKPKGSAS